MPRGVTREQIKNRRVSEAQLNLLKNQVPVPVPEEEEKESWERQKSEQPVEQTVEQPTPVQGENKQSSITRLYDARVLDSYQHFIEQGVEDRWRALALAGLSVFQELVTSIQVWNSNMAFLLGKIGGEENETKKPKL